jgi:hypothetical protein
MAIQLASMLLTHTFIHLRFFFFKNTVSAMAKQLASVLLNMLATEGSDFN